MSGGGATLAEGTVVADRYVVERLLGAGGLAEVYLVRHADLGSLHALKLLTLQRKGLPDRLLLEGRIQAQLRHPNIVAVTDVVRFEGQVALLLEYIDGAALDAWLSDRGPLPVADALALFAPIAAAVQTAHAAGVLHRDLKPANVLLASTVGGIVPKVADFGLAKWVQDDMSGTRSGIPMGTPGYMAPEQVRDSASVDGRTDVFALGAILWELIGGRRAFEDERGEVGLLSTVERDALPLDAVVDDVPPEVTRAVARALTRDRDGRFPDVRSMLEAIYPADHPVLRQVDVVGAKPLSLDRRSFGSQVPSSASRKTFDVVSAPAAASAAQAAATVIQGPVAQPTLVPEPSSASPASVIGGGEAAVPAARASGSGAAVPAFVAGVVGAGVLTVALVGLGAYWVLGGSGAQLSVQADLVTPAVEEAAAPDAGDDAVAEVAAPSPSPTVEPTLAPPSQPVAQPVSPPAGSPAPASGTPTAAPEPLAAAPPPEASPQPVPAAQPAPDVAPAPAPTVPGTAEEAPPEGPPEWMALLMGTWKGSASGRPVELRFQSWSDDLIRAEVVFPTPQGSRVFPVTGTYEPGSAALTLSGSGGLQLSATLAKGQLSGTYRQGDKKALPWSVSR